MNCYVAGYHGSVSTLVANTGSIFFGRAIRNHNFDGSLVTCVTSTGYVVRCTGLTPSYTLLRSSASR